MTAYVKSIFSVWIHSVSEEKTQNSSLLCLVFDREHLTANGYMASAQMRHPSVLGLPSISHNGFIFFTLVYNYFTAIALISWQIWWETVTDMSHSFYLFSPQYHKPQHDLRRPYTSSLHWFFFSYSQKNHFCNSEGHKNCLLVMCLLRQTKTVVVVVILYLPCMDHFSIFAVILGFSAKFMLVSICCETTVTTLVGFTKLISSLSGVTRSHKNKQSMFVYDSVGLCVTSAER